MVWTLINSFSNTVFIHGIWCRWTLRGYPNCISVDLIVVAVILDIFPHCLLGSFLKMLEKMNTWKVITFAMRNTGMHVAARIFLIWTGFHRQGIHVKKIFLIGAPLWFYYVFQYSCLQIVISASSTDGLMVAGQLLACHLNILWMNWKAKHLSANLDLAWRSVLISWLLLPWRFMRFASLILSDRRLMSGREVI